MADDKSVARSMIQQVASGAGVDEVLSSVQGDLRKCIRCGEPSKTPVCPKCKTPAVAVEFPVSSNPVEASQAVVIKPRSREITGPPVLGYLRPKDRFRFVKEVPFEGIDLQTEYHIVPSVRGTLSFTDRFEKVFDLPICYALLYEVQILGDTETEPVRKFYAGDPVKSKTTGKKGIVKGKSGDGLEVVFEGDDETTFCTPSELYMVDRLIAIKGYVREIDGEFLIKIGDMECRKPTFLEALRWLYSAHRPAFNRYSRFLRDKSREKPSGEVLEYLRKVDPVIWGQQGA